MAKNKKQQETLTEEIFEEQKTLPNEEETTQEAQENNSLAEELEALKAENAKLKEDFLRAFADAENTKRRCAQEIEKNNKYAIADFAKNLLSVADNLHRAIDAVNNNEGNENCGALKKGVELTENELMKVFGKFGISKMEIMGTVFDPNFHQVIQEVEDKNKPAGTIIAELQTGYMINGRILREAMVVVTK
ncbi:MAG: nucleotide exchange factor GrpE [Alphaproteobacteria bacterium]|nr:nucleotide exchange factor GrpE [Alphaproteobacteria bacterium]